MKFNIEDKVKLNQQEYEKIKDLVGTVRGFNESRIDYRVDFGENLVHYFPEEDLNLLREDSVLSLDIVTLNNTRVTAVFTREEAEKVWERLGEELGKTKEQSFEEEFQAVEDVKEAFEKWKRVADKHLDKVWSGT